MHIPFGAGRRLCLDTVWATMSPTGTDTSVKDARVGALALRAVNDGNVVAATGVLLGGGMEPLPRPADDASLAELARLRDQNAQLQERLDSSIAQVSDLKAKRLDTAAKMRHLRSQTTPPAQEQGGSDELDAANARIKDLELQLGIIPFDPELDAM